MTPRVGPEDSATPRLVGRLLGGAIVAGAAVAVVVTLLQWQTRPQTDDATVRANFVGIAPQVSGHIVELHVRDNQQVQTGDLLFLIDPRPYEIALERARATRALTGKEVDGLKNGAATAVAGVSRAGARPMRSSPPREPSTWPARPRTSKRGASGLGPTTRWGRSGASTRGWRRPRRPSTRRSWISAIAVYSRRSPGGSST